MLTRLQPFFDERFVFATLTQLKKTSTAPYKKVQIRPFLQGGELTFQLTYVYDKKVLHENLSAPEAAEAVAGLLENTFCQCILHTTEHDYHMTCFSRLKIKTQPPTKAGEQNLSHNKQKAYAIPDGEPCDFLIHLGVMNADGHVLKAHYDKFRQINKYLELVAGCVDSLPKDGASTSWTSAAARAITPSDCITIWCGSWGSMSGSSVWTSRTMSSASVNRWPGIWAMTGSPSSPATSRAMYPASPLIWWSLCTPATWQPMPPLFRPSAGTAVSCSLFPAASMSCFPRSRMTA